jgi:hypothetical protein
VNHLETNDPLEAVVGRALRADAENAPTLPEEWNDSTGMSILPTSPSRTRWGLMIVGAAAAAILVAALGLVAGRPFESTPAAAPPAWVPPGTEFVSTDLGPATTVYDGPVVAALSRQIGIDGHPPQVLTTSLTYSGYATAIEQVCTSESGSRGCREAWSTASWSVSETSSIDNGFATFDLWTIEGLPADAAFVSYSEGDLQLWQRPIMGFAAFPSAAGRNEVVIAYDANGTEIGQFGAAQQAAGTFDDSMPLIADISKAEFSDLGELTSNTLRECLTANGGTLVDDVATFSPDVDQMAVWEQCVGETKQAVGDAVEELNPRFYDQRSERPRNPDPALVFND